MEDVMSRVEYQAYHDEAQRMANEEAEEERGICAFVCDTEYRLTRTHTTKLPLLLLTGTTL